jgi:hypothetical protein
MCPLGITYLDVASPAPDATSRYVMQSGNGRNPPTYNRGVAHGAAACDCQPFASVVAPVMIATASVGVCDFGVITPAQPPNRAM